MGLNKLTQVGKVLHAATFNHAIYSECPPFNPTNLSTVGMCWGKG